MKESSNVIVSQEADNLLRILDEIKETMVIEGRQEEFESIITKSRS